MKENDLSLDNLLDVAYCAAQRAGNHAFHNLERRNETNATFDHDVKLVLDVECQEIAEQVINSRFMGHSILGEEYQHLDDRSEYEWVIDPIDGTMNFSQGFEYWCSSVAVRKNGKIVAGCVYAPALNKCYTAHLESDATESGKPIHVSTHKKLSEAVVATGLSKAMEHAAVPHLEMFRMLALKTKKLRINGAAALDLCRMAEGTFDAFYETGIYLWDHAAAGLIAQRAGAQVTVYPVKDSHEATVLAGNEHLLKELESIYTAHV